MSDTRRLAAVGERDRRRFERDPRLVEALAFSRRLRQLQAGVVALAVLLTVLAIAVAVIALRLHTLGVL